MKWVDLSHRIRLIKLGGAGEGRRAFAYSQLFGI
jgi:hypothetical protein